MRDAGLPRPHANASVHGEEVDAFWPEHRVVVEVDDFATHGDRVAFERDRRERARLTALGLAVLPVTGRQLEDEPLAVAATLAAALATAAAAR